MFGFLFRAPAWQLIAQADVMTKLVLLALFSLSVFCVWIILNKFLVLFRQKRAMSELQKKIKDARNFDQLLAIGKEFKDFSGGKFLIQALGDLRNILDAKKDTAALSAKKVSLGTRDFEHLQFLLDQGLGHVLAEEEKFLPVLSTSAAASPLVGLFGTVWGLVHAFVDISKNRSADIAVVAPGIAEALTTTLAGLMVAIPALVFFHYFSNELRKREQQLWGISDKFINIVKQTFMTGSSRSESKSEQTSSVEG